MTNRLVLCRSGESAQPKPGSVVVTGLIVFVLPLHEDLAAGRRATRAPTSKKAGDDGGSDSESAAAAAPKWPYYARRVPHDEDFLLGLMREGAVDYQSAPWPAGRLLVDMLSTLLMLWVSLVPMMLFIQRQVSGGGGVDKRRKPRKQMVGFDDVQGIYEAKEELVEHFLEWRWRGRRRRGWRCDRDNHAPRRHLHPGVSILRRENQQQASPTGCPGASEDSHGSRELGS